MNDRGTIKWTSLMMPEHTNLLNQLWAGENYKEKPMIEEQQEIQINTVLQQAMHHNQPVEIKHYDDGDFLTSKGKLSKIDTAMLRLDDATEIKLTDVLDVWVD
ncbi:YolD-like family protein [Virgibacillus natechei]|uniref:YolD-like family protein n=1 Tax=Virgibacillus sp. CBA3643 TaxID=2942278 RepID=UPI0035A39058